MPKGENATAQRGFTDTFRGVPGGIGSTGKLLTRIQRVGLQQFYQSPEHALQLQLLRRMSTGQDFGLSPEEAGSIQERGRVAQEAAFRQATDQVGNLGAAGYLTSGQQQQMGQNALYARSTGLADFQRQEFLRQLEEARQRPMFQLQSVEGLANALTGIPNFSQINELLRTRIMAQQAAQPAAQPMGGGGAPSGGGINWGQLAGQAGMAAAGAMLV